MAQEPCRRHEVLFDMSGEAELWNSVDDRVMGGVSRSRMAQNDSFAVFEGTVSLDYNGGFASVRSAPERFEQMAGASGIVLRVRGDGKRYGVRLRTSSSLDGVAYAASFDTREGEWEEVHIPFTAFRPEFRGRVVRDYDELDPARIRAFGLIISDNQEGPFRLDIAWIGCCLD